MYLSLNWLKEFVKFKQTPEKVAEVLTLGGFEVEEVVKWGQGLEQVIVGQIKTIISHAEANKLSVCKVDVGRKQPLTIVCGAKNVKPEQKVPVALVGTTLPNGVKIERRRIRGVDSEGMLCAEDELKLGEDHSGILILDKNLKVGQKLGKATGLEDTVLNLSLTPNRPDTYSVVGLARELAALSDQKFIEKKVSVLESKKFSVKKLLSVRVQDHNLCPKYTARVVKNVKVKSSPQWLQSRLIVSGIKPVNNIVDITNLVILEYGQPLHAFDYAKVGGRKVVVRKAGQEKSFVTLDGEKRELTPDMLMIADSKQSIAIAGVMGGDNSEISKQTRDIVIESAIFKPVSVRKTRQRLGLVTEASSRFEKGIYWELPEKAADRAAQLMTEIAGGEVAQGMIVASKQKAVKSTVVKVKLSYINNIIGRKFILAEVKKILEKLCFNVKEVSKDELKITISSFRQDVAIPADIVEEVGRMYGWNNLKPAPVYAELKPVKLPPEKFWERKVKDVLSATGMTETLNYSFYSKDLLEQFGLRTKDHYQVKNPINPEQEYMRTSLVPRLYENLMKNYQARDSIELFEVGNVFNKTIKGMPDERIMVGGIVYQKGTSMMVGILNSLFQQLGVPQISAKINAIMGPWRIVDIQIGNDIVGKYGEVQTNVDKLKNTPLFFEIDLSKLSSHAIVQTQFRSILEHPVVERDMTFKTAADVNYYDVINEMREIDELIVNVYGIKKLYKESDNNVSITFRVIYQSPERTLKSEEAEEVEKRIIKEMANKFKMELKK